MRKTMMVWSACTAALLPACLAGTAVADDVPVQGVGQQATNHQTANSAASSKQTNPTNAAVSVAILSPGAATGAVSQANNSSATSTAGNSNATDQNAGQSSGAGGAIHEAGQAAANAQGANSSADSTQSKPTNAAIHVAILSPDSGSGAVSQANNSSATSTAGNSNTTDQNAEQSAGGAGGGGGAVQATGQEAVSKQGANSSADSRQDHPTNTAIDVAILSPGSKSGTVSQANNSSATSTAGNSNTTTQEAEQSGGASRMMEQAAPRVADGCSCSPHSPGIPGVQGIGQQAINHQTANSSAESTQSKPSNTAVSLAILSPGSKSGPVSQANNSSATSTAGNSNTTKQNALQALGWGGSVQAIGQAADSAQRANSSADSTQWHPANFALGGGGGPLRQANNSGATSTAGNSNTTHQNALQALAASLRPPVVVI